VRSGSPPSIVRGTKSRCARGESAIRIRATDAMAEVEYASAEIPGEDDPRDAIRRSVGMEREGEEGVAASCVRCGECCRVRGFVLVSGEEIARIASFLGKPSAEFIERFTRLAGNRHGLELAERENGECVFLEGNACRIHPVKPRQCLEFPEGWRYPGIEEICPAWSSKSLIQPPRLPHALPMRHGGKANPNREENRAMQHITVEKPTKERLAGLGVERWPTWECEPGTFDWSYDSPETCYILEGRAKVTTPSGDVEFGKGDLVRFPEGLHCTWTVIERVRKKYSFE